MSDLTFDPDLLDLDEIDILEEITGKPLDAYAPGTVEAMPKGKLMKALAFIAGKRKDPAFTIEQAGKVKPTELEALIASLGGAGESPPEPPA